MKNLAKILLAIVILAGSHQARGDDGITGRYWFDSSTTQTPFTPGAMEIPTDGLADGLHLFNAYVQKGALTSSVSSRWFFKSPATTASTVSQVRLSVEGKPLNVVTGTHGNGIITLDLSTEGVPEGLHVLNATVVSGNSVSKTVSKWFVKTLTLRGGESYKTTLFLDGKPWRTLENQASGDGVIALQLDVNELPLGLHSLKAQVVSPNGIATGVRENMFMRVPSNAQLATMRGYYALDGKILGELEADMNGTLYHLDIDASQLNSGLHSVSTYLASGIGITTPVRTAWFIKIPEGGEGVKSYEYWLNDKMDEARRVTLDKVENSLNLIDLIEMPVEPFRTTSYTFAIEEGTPVTYARNDFQVRFSDPDGRLTLGTSTFTDVRVSRPVKEVTAITETEAQLTPDVREGEITWYSFDGEAGDSVAVRLDRAGSYELYAPDAQTMARATGADAMNSRGLCLDQNGKHYLAVHDMETRYGKPTLFVSHIPRCAVLSWTPEKATPHGTLILDIHGNGFDNLESIALEKDGTRVEPTEWVAHNRYDLTAQFNLDGKNLALGKYDIVATYKEDGKQTVVTKTEAVEFAPKAKSDVSVTVVAPRIAQTPYEVHIDVVNNSEQAAWGVPVNIAFHHSKGGMAVSFKNFYPLPGDTISHLDYILTPNLLNTGMSGVMFPIVVPYIGPKETIRLTLGLRTAAHEIVRMYAWNGQPWSDEFDEIMDDGYDFEQINNLTRSNIISAKALIYFKGYVAENSEQSQQHAKRRANPRDLRRIANAAEHASNVSQASGMAIGGVINGMRLHNLNATLEAYGVDLSDGTYSSLQDYQNDLRAGMPTPGSIVATAFGYGDVYGVAEQYMQDAASCSNPMPEPHDIDCYQSGDPNDMHGYVSPSGDNYIGTAVKSVEYTVEFENDPKIANAPASVITVENTLDGKSLDLASFKPLKMIIGKKETELPAEHHFVKTLDMRPEINSVAELTFDYDAKSGKASWALRSLDPMTMEPTRYMDDGILPVNDDSGRGTGYLSYSIDLKNGIADGTEIANSAVIVFDDNEPIPTPVWTNITDYTLPEATIAGKELSEDALSCTLTFEGSDSGAGIWYYDLYARAAGSDRWELVRSQIEDDTYVHESTASLANTDFAVIATDRAGNRQSDAAISGLAGDADGNGEINATDVVVTRNYYMDPKTQINLRNADVTVDGVVNAQDATVIRNLYLGEEIQKINNRKPTRRK